jgi:CBS domain-containing protein
MELRDIMVPNVVTIESDKFVKEAAERMNLYEIGCLVVVDKGKEAVGILTERDILRKTVETSKNAGKIRVSEIMTAKLVVGTPDMEVVDAARLMLKRKIKKLPVVTDNKLVGIVTFTDIVRTIRMEPEIMNVINDLIKSGWLPPKSMKNIIEFYIG